MKDWIADLVRAPTASGAVLRGLDALHFLLDREHIKMQARSDVLFDDLTDLSVFEFF